MKLAICLGRDVERSRVIVEKMLNAQRHDAPGDTRVIVTSIGSVGLLGRPYESTAEWQFWSDPRGDFLAFAGLPLQSGTRGGGPLSDALPLVRDALNGDPAGDVSIRLGDLDGAFVGVWWCARRQELTVVSDILGMQPLYQHQSADGFTMLSSEVKAMVQSGAVSPDVDAAAWAAMIYFGHQIGARSLLAGVTRFPPATAAVFTESSPASIRRIWRWDSSDGMDDSPSLRDAIGEALRRDVAAYASAYPEAAVLFSGGFDSRLILCLCREIGLSPRLLIQDHPNEDANADGHFARAFARARKLPSQSFGARREFFSSGDYLSFLMRNEVSTPSMYLFIATVASILRNESSGVWEGLLLGPALKFDYGVGGFQPYIAARTARRRRVYGDALRSVFSAAWVQQMEEEYRVLLATEVALFPDDAEGVWQFSVRNRTRFRTGTNPYQVYDSVTAPLTPGMSRAFWNLASRIHPSARFNKRLYLSVFEHVAPEGLALPVASGGMLIPGRGGAWLYQWQRLRAAIQRASLHPRLARTLQMAGLQEPFTWRSSRFTSLALSDANLADPRLNADWLVKRRRRVSDDHSDDAAMEILMYWQAWSHAVHGNLESAWGIESAVGAGS